MLPRTRRFRRPSSKAPKASSSPKRATRAIASVAGSSWNRSVCSAPARGCYSCRQNNAISRGRPPVTRIVPATRRRILQAAAASSVVALAKAPAFAQAQPKKLVFAHVTASPESSAVAFEAMAKEVTERSNGELAMEFHGGTLLTKELEIINAVKAGNIAMGDPGGAAATVFPEMGVFLVPYLIASYDQAYKMFNGAVGDRLDKAVPGQVQAQGPVLLRLRLPPFLEQQAANRRAERPARSQDARAAGQGICRHDQRTWRRRGADGVGRGHPGGAAGGHRRRRSAHRQHPGAKGV